MNLMICQNLSLAIIVFRTQPQDLLVCRGPCFSWRMWPPYSPNRRSAGRCWHTSFRTMITLRFDFNDFTSFLWMKLASQECAKRGFRIHWVSLTLFNVGLQALTAVLRCENIIKIYSSLDAWSRPLTTLLRWPDAVSSCLQPKTSRRPWLTFHRRIGRK